ncbi:MAG: MATE family efflux transporter [Fibrobacter sp.]|nr:MATE family efflux transporter [Fibrobacter sp.]
MQRNLHEGNLLKNIGIFSIPFLLSSFLQTLYGVVDLFIVGQFTDAAGITAVAVGSQVMHFITVIIVGFSMGITVTIAQSVGAKRNRSIARILGNAIVLFSYISVALTLLLTTICPQIVSALSTPVEAIEFTKSYLFVCFWGLPLVVAYNVISAAFRGVGDSKSPMYFIAAACVINIGLDFVFVGPLNMGVKGAAIATIISQGLSVVIALLALRYSKKVSLGVGLARKDFRLHKGLAAKMTSIGTPVAVQDGFIQISFLLITAIANSRGLEIAAAVGVVEKIICFLFLVPSAMLSTVSAIGAQNIGAGQIGRAKQTLAYGCSIAAGFGLIVGILFQFISEPVLAWFTDDPKVIIYGAQYLHAYVFDCMVAGVHFCFSGYFCACGLSIISFAHNAISIVTLRIPGVYLSSLWYPDTLFPMGIATLAGSTLSMIICIVAFVLLSHRESRKA